MIQLEGLQEVTRHRNGYLEPSFQLILLLRWFSLEGVVGEVKTNVVSSAIEEHRGYHMSTAALFLVWLQRQRVQMHTSKYSECQGTDHI